MLLMNELLSILRSDLVVLIYYFNDYKTSFHKID